MKLFEYGFKKEPISLLPDWAQDKTMYRGDFKTTDGRYVGSSSRMNAADVLSSGKVCADFMAALFRTTSVMVGECAVDGYGTNSRYGVGEFSDAPVAGSPFKTAVYERTTGDFYVNGNGNSIFKNAVYFMAMWGVFMEDAEFSQIFRTFAAAYNSPNCDEYIQQMKVCSIEMADVAYEMVRENGKHSVTQGKITESGPAQLQRVSYKPTSVTGCLQLLNTRGAQRETEDRFYIADELFPGHFHFGHTLTDEEKKMVPILPSNEHPSKLTRAVCTHVQSTTCKVRKIRNILLYGPTGTGKSTIAKHIATGLGLPFGSLNCNADTTVMDLLCQCMPKGGGNKLSIENPDGFPDADEMMFYPETAWKKLTGVDDAHATTEMCVSAAYEKLTGKKKSVSMSEYLSVVIDHAVDSAEKATGQEFVYVESPIVLAARNGWVCEVQEPSTIVQGGVLPGLNSLLDADGQLFLPTGEVVKRHPDCVIIATTNIGYEGCRPMNQSFLRRFQFKAIVDNPSDAVALARLKDMVGYSEELDYVKHDDMIAMLDVAHQIKEECKCDLFRYKSEKMKKRQ